ncbi:MAG: GIY-YIG nuclease family protein [Bacteroidia bacterium]|nr:GIY-YIG nuclease family protein [Bacteroidia bacterium]
MLGIIYKITNITNDKIYIGKTEREIEERWKEHLRDSGKERNQNRPLYRAINKYGQENFIIEEIEQVDSESLGEREQYWINYYQSFSMGGYNATFGGEGKTLYNYDLIVEKFNSGMLGDEIMKEFGCDRNAVTSALKKANVYSNKNNLTRRSRAVLQYDLNGNFIEKYSSINEAGREIAKKLDLKADPLHISTNISRVARGKRKTCYKYLWKFEDV